jgi:phosphatidate cytidylyltransferase
LVRDGQRRSAPAARWNDLRRRVLSAAVLAPVALFCIWFGAAAFAALILLAGVGLSAEWVALCSARPAQAPGLFVPALVLLAGLLTTAGQPGIGLGLLAAGFGVLWRVSGRSMLAAGILYVGLALVSLLWLRAGVSAAGRVNVLYLVLVVWASDIGAYTAGRLLRGPKLAPSLSPGKTWSGAIGGLLAAVLAGQAAASGLAGAPWGAAAALGGLIGVACQAGDLLESGIKRHFGVKDSGRLIPGHGGLLDRLDGLLAAAPVAALVLLAGRGEYLWH